MPTNPGSQKKRTFFHRWLRRESSTWIIPKTTVFFCFGLGRAKLTDTVKNMQEPLGQRCCFFSIQVFSCRRCRYFFHQFETPKTQPNSCLKNCTFLCFPDWSNSKTLNEYPATVVFFPWKKNLRDLFNKNSGYTQSTKLIDPTIGSFLSTHTQWSPTSCKWILVTIPKNGLTNGASRGSQLGPTEIITHNISIELF